MIKKLNRRTFLEKTGTGLSAAVLAAQMPELVAAAAHARHAAKSGWPEKFQFFTPEQAKEVDALTARIIPSDDTPGAREAGAVYFIDRALATFATDDQKAYEQGLLSLQTQVAELFPGVLKFSAATAEQQDEALVYLDPENPENARPRIAGSAKRADPFLQSFFETVRMHTITAFLVDPESGGNRDAVGWKLIGRDPAHVFQPPFGYYDKEYPGYQMDAAQSASGEKK